ncbi:MAG: GNAT family N-acetyltransferase [Candidatus Bathyarchaeota archaeon]|nr:MAG: GNAT family N-acetyltransferase [Candidatus Bathyarchaeota archaeon]
MKSIEVRTLKIQDYEAMINLWRQADLPFKPKGRDSKSEIQKQMEAVPEYFIGAFHQDKLVGVVIGSYDGRMKGWINRLAVHPAYRQKGIAQQLTRNVEKTLKEHGAAIFCALIEAPNKESFDLFQKLGYSIHRETLYVTKRRSKDL